MKEPQRTSLPLHTAKYILQYLKTQPSFFHITITMKETEMWHYFMCDIHTNTGDSTGNSEIPDGRDCRIPVSASNTDG